MDKIEFEKILLQTAFCCLASDGNVDEREISLLKSVFSEKEQYKDLNFDEKINSFIKNYNEKGKQFFTFYFNLLKESQLNEEEELSIVNIAIKTIKADDLIEYSEIKFFKIIRHNLKISDEKILAVFPDIEQFLEKDIITESYLEKITNQYLDVAELPKFEMISFLSDSPNEIKKDE
jgi:uncharacterized tellurite resistance protein B-like protein